MVSCSPHATEFSRSNQCITFPQLGSGLEVPYFGVLGFTDPGFTVLALHVPPFRVPPFLVSLHAQKMPPPTNISESRSFSGMTNYLSRFIPNYSMCIYHLLELTKKNIPQLWTNKHQTIFDDLKTELISPKVMSYYDPSLNSLKITDASPVGISAILLQQSSDSS